MYIIHTHTAVRGTKYTSHRIHSKCMHFLLDSSKIGLTALGDMVSFPLFIYFIRTYIYVVYISTLSSGCWVLLLDSNNIACFIHVIRAMHRIWSFSRTYAYASLGCERCANDFFFAFVCCCCCCIHKLYVCYVDGQTG